jgi:hypothetical protein
MREVTFIESFNIRTVMAGDIFEYQLMGEVPNIAIGTDTFLESVPIETKIAPVTRLCDSAKPDVFIAYSQEVEDTLGIPIKIIIDRSKECHAELYNLQIWQSGILRMTMWDRIKAVFKGYKK